MGNSSSNSSASVRVALEHPQYTAGQAVKGYVEVQVAQPMACQNVYAKFVGEVRTTVHYTTRHSRTVDGKTETHTEHHTAHGREFIVQEKVLVASFPGQASPGLYQFPFEFPIHPRLPSSSYIQGHDHACLNYGIEVQLERPGFMKWDLVSRTYFDVVALVPHAITPSSVRDVQAVKTLCCIHHGDMDLTSHLQKNAYCGSEAVVSHVELHNHSTKAANSVNLELIEVVHFRAEGHSSSRKQCIARRQITGGLEGGNSLKQNIDMQLPIEFRNCSMQSQLLQITHHVEVRADTPYCTSNPCVKMPVTLYRSPVVSAFPASAPPPPLHDGEAVPFVQALPYNPNYQAMGSPILVHAQVVSPATPNVWAEASAPPPQY